MAASRDATTPVCAACRHLNPPSAATAPPGAWCPLWGMWVANPAATGCTLFESRSEGRPRPAPLDGEPEV